LDLTLHNIREVESLLDQASSLIERQLFDEAMTKLRIGLAADPTNVRALENLVICNLELGKPKLAIQALNNLLQIEPSSPVRWGDKGYIHLLLNEYSEGIGALKQSLKLQPRDVRKWELLATALISEDLWDDAVDALERSLDLDPSSAVAWYNLAICHLYFEDFGSAIEAAEYAVSLDPSFEELADEWIDLIGEELVEEEYPLIDGIAAS
jgi:tetratricopeptide (TPR) repeat protein